MKALVLAVVATGALSAETYHVGHSWVRNHDWAELGASQDGTDLGNPAVDALGVPVWEYRSVSGGTSSDGPQPWFTRPSVKMVWRSSSTAEQPPNTWGAGAEVPMPFISHEALCHSGAAPHLAPLQVWENVTGETISLRIYGRFRLEWSGSDASSGETEVVVGRSAPGGAWETIKLVVVERPDENEVSIPIDTYVEVGPGARISTSLRIKNPSIDLRVVADDLLNYERVAPDMDRDGIDNETEARSLGTDPLLPDSDHDGWDDRAEVQFGVDPLSAVEVPPLEMQFARAEAASGMQIMFPTRRWNLYTVEESENLADWTALIGDFRGEGSVRTEDVTISPNTRQFFRATERPLPLDPAVESYQLASGITAASAERINTMLADLRAAGMDPAFFWVGGSSYNVAAQTLAVIGGVGGVAGLGVANPWGETASGCRFNRGKFLEFDQPAALRAEKVESLAVAVWYEELDYSESSAVLNTFDTTARGWRISQTASGEPRLASFVAALGANNANVFPVPTYVRAVKNRFCYFQFEAASPTSTRVSAMIDDDAFIRDVGPLYNNFAKIRIGGESTTLSPLLAPYAFANCRVTAVALAPNGPKPSFITTASGSTVVGGLATAVSEAPFNSAILQPSKRCRIVTLGDSITASKWNSIAFSTGPHGGAWVNGAVVEDFAVGGTSMDFHISLTVDVKRALARSSSSLAYFIYTPEEILGSAAIALGLSANDSQGWYDRMETWLKEIEEETGCQVVLCSYIKGNTASSQAGQQHRDVVKEMVKRNGWRYVPLWEDPHSQVWAGSVPGSYGFYADMIHQTPAGSRVQAEIVSAVLPNPYRSNAPRADLNHAPAVIGSLLVGESLDCDSGRWFQNPDQFEFQWLRNLSPIPGATSRFYSLTLDDVGKRIACRVTALKAGEPSSSFTSSPTEPVSE